VAVSSVRMPIIDASGLFGKGVAPSRVSSAHLSCESNIFHAIEHMHQHLTGGLSIPALARHVGMSPSQFWHHFRHITSLSPSAFWTHLRMCKPEHLPKLTNQPIKAVADSLGYNTLRTFCRVFHRYHGITASAFRSSDGKCHGRTARRTAVNRIP